MDFLLFETDKEIERNLLGPWIYGRWTEGRYWSSHTFSINRSTSCLTEPSYVVSTGNLQLAAAVRKALDRVSHTTDYEEFTSWILDFISLFWLEWYFSFSSLLLPSQNLIFWKIKNLYQASSIFFLNIPLKLKRRFENKITLFSKNCQYKKRGMETKCVTRVYEILCSYMESQSLLHIGSILVPLNPTTLTNTGLSGILIIRRQFESSGTGISLEQRQR